LSRMIAPRRAGSRGWRKVSLTGGSCGFDALSGANLRPARNTKKITEVDERLRCVGAMRGMTNCCKQAFSLIDPGQGFGFPSVACGRDFTSTHRGGL